MCVLGGSRVPATPANTATLNPTPRLAAMKSNLPVTHAQAKTAQTLQRPKPTVPVQRRNLSAFLTSTTIMFGASTSAIAFSTRSKDCDVLAR